MNLNKDFIVEVEGEMPLIMHSDTLCNPLHPLTKEIKKISSVRSKKDEHYEKMAELEFLGALYYNKELGVYMPTNCIIGSLKAAARKFKLGRAIKALILDDAIGYSLKELKGLTPKALWNELNEEGSQKFVYSRSVVVNRSRIMRTLPIINNWSFTFTGQLLVELLSIEQFQQILTTSGFECGLCELRPEKASGAYGKFSIKSLKIDGKNYVQD